MSGLYDPLPPPGEYPGSDDDLQEEVEVGLLAMVLAVEAAGSVNRAVRAGLLADNHPIIRMAKALAPASRGGDARGPNAERDWGRLAIEALLAFGHQQLLELQQQADQKDAKR